MTIGNREAMDSIIDAGVASVDAIDTAMSAEAHKNGSSGAGEEHPHGVAEPELVTHPRSVSVLDAPASREDQPCLRHLVVCALEGPDHDVKVRVRAIVPERQHDQRVIGPPEPRRERRVVAVLRPERPQIDVPDDAVDRRRTAPSRTVSSAFPSDDTTNSSPAAIDSATYLRPRRRSRPYVKMSVFQGA